MRTSDLNRKNVSVHLDTYARLQKYGEMNESFSDVIDNIIDFAEDHGLSKTELVLWKVEHPLITPSTQ